MNPEQYLCGAILISGEQVLQAIRGLVTADCFQYETYRAIFTAGLSLLENGSPIDPISIAAAAKRQGVELPNAMLAELMEIVPTAANCVDYAHRVAEEARKREIKKLAAPGYRRTGFPPLTSFWRPCSGKARPSREATASVGCCPPPIRCEGSWTTL